MTVEPVLIVEHETSPGVWVDISSRLRRAKTKRGRRRSVDVPGAGSMILTLSNADRGLDPEHAGTTIFPNQHIRLRATWGTTRNIFNGRIERIIQDSRGPNDAVAILECVDGMAELHNKRLASPWLATMQKYPTRVWYRFGSNTEETLPDNSGHNRSGKAFDASDTDGLLDSDDDGAIEFGSDSFAIIGPESFPLNSSFSIHFLLNAMPLPLANAYLLYSEKFPRGFQIYMDTLGRINVRYVDPNTGIQTAYSRTSLSLHAIDYQLSINVQAGQPIRIFSDDADITDIPASVGTGGVIISADYYVLGNGTNAVMDEFFVSDTLLDATARLDLVYARLGWGLMPISTRLNKVLTAVGWSTANLISDFTDEVLRAAVLSDASAVEHLQSVARSMEGIVFQDKDGKINFIGQTQRNSLPRSASQITFTESLYLRLGTFAFDMASVLNEVTRITEASGLGAPAMVITARDQNSIDDYGLRNNGPYAIIESELRTSAEREYQLAAYRIAHHREPLTTIDALVISPRGNPTVLFPEVLDRELGNVVTLERQPQGAGAVMSKRVIVEGIEHDIGPKHWETRYSVDATGALSFFQFDITLWDSSDWRFSA